MSCRRNFNNNKGLHCQADHRLGPRDIGRMFFRSANINVLSNRRPREMEREQGLIWGIPRIMRPSLVVNTDYYSSLSTLEKINLNSGTEPNQVIGERVGEQVGAGERKRGRTRRKGSSLPYAELK